MRNEQILALSTATIVHVNVAAECARANNPLACADAKPVAAQKP
jgi:hypothetical protein